MPIQPVIPETITVHMGPPASNAENVTVSFPDYIKNVASSEIYPTWPENSLRANIYAIITFALNRVYTEFYRSQGYNFDITSSTAYDQSFVRDRNIFDDISIIVDDIFNDYVRRQGFIEPYFTQFCNGTTVTCRGLSQWGTVDLANQGYTPYQILQYYYGDNIDIVRDAPIQEITESYPGTPLVAGDFSDDVMLMQTMLQRISANYPAIPKISNINGLFGGDTYDAVRTFQQIFNLTPDGIIGKSTWYRIIFIFNAVKRLAEIDSEGLRLEDISRQFPGTLQRGSTGKYVEILQYYLRVVGDFNNEVPSVELTGIFGEETENALISFQRWYGLSPDGIAGRETWNALYEAYLGILDSVPRNYWTFNAEPFPGVILRIGMSGPSVSTLQTYLSFISNTYTDIPKVSITGNFDEDTQDAVEAFQRRYNLDVTGIVDPVTWDNIATVYSDLYAGSQKRMGQFPGYVLSENS